MRISVLVICLLAILTSTSWGESGNTYFQYPIFAVNLLLGNNSLTISDYSLYNGAFLDENAKTKLRESVPSCGMSLFGYFSSSASYVISRNILVSLRIRGGEYANLPEDLLDFLLFGNEMGRTYSLEGACGEARALGELGVGYEQKVDFLRGLKLGAAIKIVKGFAYGSITQARGSLTTTEAGITGDGIITTVRSDGGMGAGIDLWAEKSYSDIRISISILDAYTSLSWTQDCLEETNGILVDLEAGESFSRGLLETGHETRKLGTIRDRLSPKAVIEIRKMWHSWLMRGTYRQTLGRDAFGSGRPAFCIGISPGLLKSLSFEAKLGWDGEAGLIQGVNLAVGRRNIFRVDLNCSPLPIPSRVKRLSISMGIFRSL